MAYLLRFCGGMAPQSTKYETLETRKDGTKFLSRDMKRAATRLQQLATAYDSKQQKLVEEACPRRINLARTLRALKQQMGRQLMLELVMSTAGARYCRYGLSQILQPLTILPVLSG